MKADSDKTNLIGLPHMALQEFLAGLGEKSYRAVQIMKWIYHHGVIDTEEMSNISKSLRQTLAQCAEVRLTEPVSDQPSSDGTRKWLLRLECGNCIETVFIPETDRGTLCISSQVGCALNCTFCSTATQGFNRNLTVHEIIGQVLFAARTLGISPNRSKRKITNIVLMGMGEPLVNYDNVVAAIDLMLDDNAFGLSKRRVTISTAGLVPAIHKLVDSVDVSLAVSIHASNDQVRDRLVPLNKKYPIAELLPACKQYIADKPHRKITWEYVMLRGVNDLDEHARELAQLLKGIPSKINLIPFNSFPGTEYECSLPDRIGKFRNILINQGFPTIVRKTRGDDIDAACGQLVGSFTDRTRRQGRAVEIQRANGNTSNVIQTSAVKSTERDKRESEPHYEKFKTT